MEMTIKNSSENFWSSAILNRNVFFIVQKFNQ